jgi:hypothetical protein
MDHILPLSPSWGTISILPDQLHKLSLQRFSLLCLIPCSNVAEVSTESFNASVHVMIPPYNVYRSMAQGTGACQEALEHYWNDLPLLIAFASLPVLQSSVPCL